MSKEPIIPSSFIRFEATETDSFSGDTKELEYVPTHLRVMTFPYTAVRTIRRVRLEIAIGRAVMAMLKSRAIKIHV